MAGSSRCGRNTTSCAGEIRRSNLPIRCSRRTRASRSISGTRWLSSPSRWHIASRRSRPWRTNWCVQLLLRFFTHTEETDEQLETLIGSAIEVMAGVVRPLGTALARLPFGPDHEDHTAGFAFEMYYQLTNLIPGREPSWALLHERMSALVDRCAAVAAQEGAPDVVRGCARPGGLDLPQPRRLTSRLSCCRSAVGRADRRLIASGRWHGRRLESSNFGPVQESTSRTSATAPGARKPSNARPSPCMSACSSAVSGR